MNQNRNPNWWDRNWKWFVPAVCVTFLLVVFSFIGLIFYGVSSMMKSSDPYQVGVQAAKENPEVVAAIGEPISEGFFTSGNINTNGSSGEANLAIPISGPKGDAIIQLDATQSLGRWTFKGLVVDIEKTNDRIDLLQEK